MGPIEAPTSTKSSTRTPARCAGPPSVRLPKRAQGGDLQVRIDTRIHAAGIAHGLQHRERERLVRIAPYEAKRFAHRLPIFQTAHASIGRGQSVPMFPSALRNFCDSLR